MVSTPLLRHIPAGCAGRLVVLPSGSNIPRLAMTNRSHVGATSCSEVLEGATELRIMLCKEKRTAGSSRVGTSVVAACGERTHRSRSLPRYVQWRAFHHLASGIPPVPSENSLLAKSACSFPRCI